MLIDLNKSYTLEAEQLYQRHKHSPYVGEELHCKIKATYVRGRLVYEESEGLSESMQGEWVRH